MVQQTKAEQIAREWGKINALMIKQTGLIKIESINQENNYFGNNIFEFVITTKMKLLDPKDLKLCVEKCE